MSKPVINEEVFDQICFEAHCAAFRAIDDAINENLDSTDKRSYWVMDKHVPNLTKVIDEVIKDALSEEYELVI